MVQIFNCLCLGREMPRKKFIIQMLTYLIDQKCLEIPLQSYHLFNPLIYTAVLITTASSKPGGRIRHICC
uniref:Uncharacterized protein n=1 Tax=Tanacetum cinerariifolium TaxID=118510 RepID=A0A6L2J4Q9_TANCI|nr:hypothetical protein [Tanacetum cinerariifolium]